MQRCGAANRHSTEGMLRHIPAELVAFLRYDSLRSEPHRVLRAIASLGRATDAGGVLPNPTRGVLAGHALVALVAAAISDAARLDEISASELLDRTRKALVTGNPDDDQVLAILGRADELVNFSLERVHAAYQEAGAKRPVVDIPSLKDVVMTPPAWVARYVDLVKRFRANPAVARQMLQTAELRSLRGTSRWQGTRIARIRSPVYAGTPLHVQRCAAVPRGDCRGSSC